ncbi:MAG: hypothetical protein GEU90_23095, partial [Gemmatimonas sp.]|nr:hypothetical protein [Gemmatimonas sp.]
GVDEVSWRRRHRYLTLITDHAGKKIVWGAEGKDAATMDEFFADLGAERAERLTSISMDMGAAFNKSARENALNATRCIDPYPSMSNDARPGTNYELCPTRMPRRRSRAPGGCCSNARRTSPRTKPRPCASCVTGEGRCGGPTASRKPSVPSSPATSTPPRPPPPWTAGARWPADPGCPR